MVERWLGPDAHEFPGTNFNAGFAHAVLEMWRCAAGHDIEFLKQLVFRAGE